MAPEVLRWIREASGIPAEEAARRIGISPSRLAGAEAGEAPLTLNQARKAADVYQRPFALFFLPVPPQEDPVEIQFRRLRDAPALPWPPAMRVLAREVPALQEQAAALLEAIEEEVRWTEATALFAESSDPDVVGRRLRELLGVSVEDQKAAARLDPQGFRAFRIWRVAMEDLGTLVLQDGSLPLEDMRGFASPHPAVPAVVINTNDDVRARLFTMLHEFAHLFWTTADETKYEEFAGTTLMPREPFSRDFASTSAPNLLDKIDAVARLYSVTSDAAAVRAGWLNLAPWDAVQEVRAELRARGVSGGRATGGNFYRNVVVRFGPRFVSRVLSAVDQSAMSELAAARLLHVRVERFEQLRQELGGAEVA